MFIEQYVKLRFRNTAGAIQTVGNGIGQLMYFSNLEIKGSITEHRRGKTNIFQTYGGNAASSPSTQPRAFSFTINLDQKITLWKLDYLNEALRQGFRIEFWILSGYLTYSATGAVVDDLVESDPTLPYAIVELTDGEQTHRQIRRGIGTVHATETNIKVYEGAHLAIPNNAGLPQASDLPDPSD